MPNAVVFSQAQWFNARAGFKPTVFNQLVPMMLSDGRFAVSANVLNDPLFSGISAILAAGSIEDISPSSYASLGDANQQLPRVNGERMLDEAALAGWSLSAPAVNILHFELKPGDQGYPTDPIGIRHRSELISYAGRLGMGVAIWCSWSFRIVEYGGLDVPGNYSICGQWHMNDVDRVGRKPPFAINFAGKKLIVWSHSSGEIDGSDAVGNGVTKVRYSGPTAVPLSTWMAIVVKVTFGPNGGLEVWLNGSKIVDLPSGLPMGYYLDSSPLVYWEFGCYGGDINHPDVISAGGQEAMRTAHSKVEYANMEFGTVDLTSRISSPLQV